MKVVDVTAGQATVALDAAELSQIAATLDESMPDTIDRLPARERANYRELSQRLGELALIARETLPDDQQ